MILARNFLNIFLLSLLVLGLIINPSLFQNPIDSSNNFVSHSEFTHTNLMKFAFAQSDEDVGNQTKSDNIVELNETITIAQKVAEAEAEEAEEAIVVEEEEVEGEQTGILILIGIVIAAAAAGIAVALLRRKKVTTSTKASTTKKFCGKCGSPVPKTVKFCGKCGASLYQKK